MKRIARLDLKNKIQNLTVTPQPFEYNEALDPNRVKSVMCDVEEAINTIVNNVVEAQAEIAELKHLIKELVLQCKHDSQAQKAKTEPRQADSETSDPS